MGAAGALHGPRFIPGAAQAPQESRQLTAPSARLKAGAVGGVPEVPQVLPMEGSPHSLPHSPLGWVSTAGFLFAAQHSGTEAPQTPFRGGQPHAVLFPLLEAKEQGHGCPLILPKVQSSLSSTLQTAASTTKQQHDVPIGPKERNTGCKPESCERRLALQEERKAGKIGELANFSPGKFQDLGLTMDWVCKYHSHVFPQIRAWLGDKVRAAMPSSRQEGKHRAWIPGTVCSQPRSPASNSVKHTRAAWKEVLGLLAKRAGRSGLLGNVFCPGWGQGKRAPCPGAQPGPPSSRSSAWLSPP